MHSKNLIYFSKRERASIFALEVRGNMVYLEGATEQIWMLFSLSIVIIVQVTQRNERLSCTMVST